MKLIDKFPFDEELYKIEDKEKEKTQLLKYTKERLVEIILKYKNTLFIILRDNMREVDGKWIYTEKEK